MTNEEIDQVAASLQDMLVIAAQFYRPFAPAVPLLKAWIAFEGFKLKHGLASGELVSDGAGGFVPASNSHYDSKTGEFL